MIESLETIFRSDEYKELIDKHGYGPYNHLYLKYPIKKKSGKLRWLNPPMEPLKTVQSEFLEKVSPLLEPHKCAVGFRKNKSVIDGAKAHLDSNVLLTLDLKDFFNNVDDYKIRSVCRNFTAALDSLDKIEEGEFESVMEFFISLVTGPKGLSQGAPTSPAISNLVGKHLDRELFEFAQEKDLIYTRYADDLTFSTKDESVDMYPLQQQIKSIIRRQNFIINTKKTRIQRPHRRMSVTGIVVNDKLSVPKWKWRQFRAKLHNIERDKTILTDKELEEIEGYAQWIKQLHPKRGQTFQDQIGRIKSFQP